jgi:hypothetical protein
MTELVSFLPYLLWAAAVAMAALIGVAGLLVYYVLQLRRQDRP